MKRLGIGIEPASTQVVPRDRHAAVLSAVALAGAGLERFATEVRNLQKTEVREVEEPFGKGQKGSSAMPHKRNPITTERITGLARVLRGYAQAGLENVALWHERDISHSGAERVIIPDATIGLDYMQHLATRVASGMVVHPERMRENLELTYGAIYSQRALTALIDAGMVRDDAYRVIQENAQAAWDTRTPFRDLLTKALESTDLEVDVDAIFDPGAYLANAEEVFERLETQITPHLDGPSESGCVTRTMRTRFVAALADDEPVAGGLDPFHADGHPAVVIGPHPAAGDDPPARALQAESMRPTLADLHRDVAGVADRLRLARPTAAGPQRAHRAGDRARLAPGCRRESTAPDPAHLLRRRGSPGGSHRPRPRSGWRRSGGSRGTSRSRASRTAPTSRCRR